MTTPRWRGRLLAAVFAALAVAGCASAEGSGKCSDYEPIPMCSERFVYVCETTTEGCKQCNCVPKRGAGDPEHGPLGPR